MGRYQKTNIPGLLKDAASGTIINTDISGYEAIKARRKQAKEQQNLHQRVEKIENDLSEIKNLLLRLVNN